MDDREFLSRLQNELELDLPDAIGLNAELARDCGLDSLGMYELVLLLEDWGCEVTEDDLLGWFTLQDVYHFYTGIFPD